MPNDFQFCPVCGSPPSPQSTQNYYQHNYYQNVVGLKSEDTTLVLSIVLGLFGIQGVGHLYVGKIGKGLCFLIGSLILFGVAIWLITTLVGAFIGIPLLIGYLILFIWQIIDSRNLCRQYNDYLSKNGKPPW